MAAVQPEPWLRALIASNNSYINYILTNNYQLTRQERCFFSFYVTSVE
jgi:hypothetical protein